MHLGRRSHQDEAEAEPPVATPADVEDEVLPCIRCQQPLTFVAEQDLHEGTRAWGFLLGNVGELMTGGTQLEMWACGSCGHVEFFVPSIG